MTELFTDTVLNMMTTTRLHGAAAAAFGGADL